MRHHKIIIKDNGIGFKQEYAEKIFMLFQRLETGPKYSGTGLGLAICKKNS
jgi:light-regulated signal transduction histidine kinase (bacteriophytochrome)